MSLKEYRRKRRFEKTPEPAGDSGGSSGSLRFVVQKHKASHLHYDFRLELDGVLKSWAVPKGPSLNPADKRLAMMTEDHPLEYRTFEGTIPKGNYGAGAVIVWDEGTYRAAEGDVDAIRKGLRRGRLHIVLSGKKLRGEWALFKIKAREENAWLLVKTADEFAVESDVREQDQSVKTGRTVQEVEDENSAETPDPAGGVSEPNENNENVDLGDLPESAMPRNVRPMLATLVDESFDREGWFFEVKWDGYRAIAEKSGSSVRLYSRNQQSFTDRYALVVQSLQELPHDLVLDGEIVVLDPKGRPSFQNLQNYQRTGKDNLAYLVFDVLWMDGKDLRSAPLFRRKKILETLLPTHSILRLSQHVEKRGLAFLKAAASQGLEGIVAKKADSPYREGMRTREWLKIKTVRKQEAVIAGFTEPRGSRRGVGALVLGLYEGGELTYVGHAGGRFTDKSLVEMRQRLDQLADPRCPFREVPKTNSPVHWVKPRIVCEVRFHEWTAEGHMRMPIFVGLREDKSPEETRRELPVKRTVALEEPVPIDSSTKESESSSEPPAQTRYFGPAPSNSEKSEDLTIQGHRLHLTHLDKVYWPDEKYTKRDLINYYRDIGSFMLPYLKDRPESLHRYPEGLKGESFYQKNLEQSLPEWVMTVNIRSDSESRNLRYLVCQNLETLLYMANLGCIEVNPWNSRRQHLDRPDYLVMDLDPVDVPFEAVIEVAHAVKDTLESLGAEGYCKTTGGRGLHIFVPMGARYSNDQSRFFSEILAHLVHDRLRHTTSLERSPLKRQKRVYLDFLQNRRGQTLVAPYSVRPKPGATVSTPLRWSELKKGFDPNRFNIRTIPKRLRSVGDLWRPVLGPGIDLEKCLAKLDDRSAP